MSKENEFDFNFDEIDFNIDNSNTPSNTDNPTVSNNDTNQSISQDTDNLNIVNEELNQSIFDDADVDFNFDLNGVSDLAPDTKSNSAFDFDISSIGSDNLFDFDTEPVITPADSAVEETANLLYYDYIENAFVSYKFLKNLDILHWATTLNSVTSDQKSKLNEFKRYKEHFDLYISVANLLTGDNSAEDRNLLEKFFIAQSALTDLNNNFEELNRRSKDALPRYILNHVSELLKTLTLIPANADSPETLVSEIRKNCNNNFEQYMKSQFLNSNYVQISSDSSLSNNIYSQYKDCYAKVENMLNKYKEDKLNSSLSELSEAVGYYNDLVAEETVLKSLADSYDKYVSTEDDDIENPIDAKICIYKNIKFLNNGKQQITCPCGAVNEHEMIRFITPSSNYNISNKDINSSSYFDKAKTIISNSSCDQEDSRYVIYRDLISKDGYTQVAKLRVDTDNVERFFINESYNPGVIESQNTVPNLLNHFSDYASSTTFHYCECEQCHKWIIPSGNDMRMFSAFHINNICNSNMIYSPRIKDVLGLSNSNRISDTKCKAIEKVVYSEKVLSQAYEDYIKALNNDDSRNDIEGRAYTHFLNKHRSTLESSDYSASNFNTSEMLRKAWNNVHDKYGSYGKRINEYSYSVTKCNRDNKLPGYYPQVNVLKLLLSKYYTEELDARNLMNFAFNKNVNSDIYYSLIFKKISTDIKAGIFTIKSFIVEDSGSYVYRLYQSGSNVIAKTDTSNLAQMCNSIKDNCRNLIKYCSTYSGFVGVNELTVAEEIDFNDIDNLLLIFDKISSVINEIISANDLLKSLYSPCNRPVSGASKDTKFYMFNREYDFLKLNVALSKNDMRLPHKANMVDVDIFDYLTPNINWEFHYGNLLAYIMLKSHRQAFVNMLSVENKVNSQIFGFIKNTCESAILADGNLGKSSVKKYTKELFSQNFIAEISSVDKKDSLYAICDTELLMQYPVEVIPDEYQGVFNRVMSLYEPIYYSVLFENSHENAISKLKMYLSTDETVLGMEESLNDDMISTIFDDILNWYVILSSSFEDLKTSDNNPYGGYWIKDSSFTMKPLPDWAMELYNSEYAVNTDNDENQSNSLNSSDNTRKEVLV